MMPTGKVKKHHTSDQILIDVAKHLRRKGLHLSSSRESTAHINAAIRIEQMVKEDYP